ncbi:hypothetical protein CHUAL_008110 [Chamberlinius hualienensis]
MSKYAESDSDDELPPDWEERVTSDGRVYYANHLDKTTHWTHPRTGKKKRVAGELPYGWDSRVTDDGRLFFIDHINQKTTFTDPRLAFAVEDVEKVDELRQRFDGSSTAFQVLHGRDLSGKVVIVTGANCGIGFETAKSLAFHGAEVILACRNILKAQEVVSLIHKERPFAKVKVIHLDLSRLASVYEFVASFKKDYRYLHILILNAAIFGVGFELTENGYESIFQVNHLGHFLLTKLLEDVLILSAPARVVVVSSESHRFSDLIEDNISIKKLSPVNDKNFMSMSAYNLSKMCNVLFSIHLNTKLGSKGVTSNCLHPGNMVSSYLSRNWWFYRLAFALVRPFTKSLQQAASTSVYCATAPELENIGGLYFNNCCRCEPATQASNLNLAQKLWNICEEMVATGCTSNIQSQSIREL